jgi:hypothetical protein
MKSKIHLLSFIATLGEWGLRSKFQNHRGDFFPKPMKVWGR